MRYIELEETTRLELEKVYHTHAKSHVRQRAQCLLLSDQGYSVPVLADIYSTRTHTPFVHGLTAGNQKEFKVLKSVPVEV